MSKAVFLDRDGTINVDTGYIADTDELVFIRGSKKAVKLLKDKGFSVYIVTNQSGVERGYFTIEKLKEVNDKLISEFAKDDIKIDGLVFCPHHPDKKCDCRKPKPKMVLDMARKGRVNLEESYFVGDKIIDVQTGKNAGCKTVLVQTETTLFENEDDWTDPDFIAKDLLEAAKWIVKNETTRLHKTSIARARIKSGGNLV